MSYFSCKTYPVLAFHTSNLCTAIFTLNREQKCFSLSFWVLYCHVTRHKTHSFDTYLDAQSSSFDVFELDLPNLERSLMWNEMPCPDLIVHRCFQHFYQSLWLRIMHKTPCHVTVMSLHLSTVPIIKEKGIQLPLSPPITYEIMVRLVHVDVNLLTTWKLLSCPPLISPCLQLQQWKVTLLLHFQR